MTTPRFTAAASLYKTNGHYRTGGDAITLPRLIIGKIYPAEVIEVYGCTPGFLPLGEGENMICIPDPTVFGGNGGGSDGGGTDGGPPGRGGAGTGTGRGGRDRTPRPHPARPVRRKYDFNCSLAQAASPEATKCSRQGDQDLLKNTPYWHGSLCEPPAGNPEADPVIKCCAVNQKNYLICWCTLPNGDQEVYSCG
jgi:hypothetical protein